MRQSAECDVDVIPIDLVGGDEVRQAKGAEMGEDFRERLAGMAFGDERGDLNMRVSGGEPNEIGAGIAGCAEHSGTYQFSGHGRNS